MTFELCLDTMCMQGESLWMRLGYIHTKALIIYIPVGVVRSSLRWYVTNCIRMQLLMYLQSVLLPLSLTVEVG